MGDVKEPCGCLRCLRSRRAGEYIGSLFIPEEMRRMVVCAKCGCKRCPHATDCRLECTDSNEPGQPGSVYGEAA